MEQEKIARLIKQLRHDNHLTQKQFADKYNVSYQAVSKWENGLNLPDTHLLKQISKDFNISIDDIFDGVYSKKNNRTKVFIIVSITLIIIVAIIGIIFICNRSIKSNDFYFKTLSSACNYFDVSGNIAYNDKKSAIYITNIKYCGEDDKKRYQQIECILYESSQNIEKKISSNSYMNKSNMTLSEYLQTVTFTVDDYQKNCKEYSDNSLYLSVNAKDMDDKVITYKIPLSLEQSCSK